MPRENALNSGSTRLGEREVQILSLAADGLADKEIATQLDISFTTVRSYWERIRDKLGAVNRAHAVALGMPHNRVERGREELDGFILRAISDEAIFACSVDGTLLTWNRRQAFVGL